jgi:hypothetical protein
LHSNKQSMIVSLRSSKRFADQCCSAIKELYCGQTDFCVYRDKKESQTDRQTDRRQHTHTLNTIKTDMRKTVLYT